MRIFPKVPDLLINQTKRTSHMNSYEKRDENLNSIERAKRLFNQEQKPKSINQILKDKRLMNFKSKIKSNKHIHTSTTKSKQIKTLKIINQPTRVSARVRKKYFANVVIHNIPPPI